MIITASEKSLLSKHLADLSKTISACLCFGVAYDFPGYFNVADLKLDTGLASKPVSNFDDLLLWVQILLRKCENNEFKQNPLLFEKSILQIEAIISNSLLNADFVSANLLYRYIFGQLSLSSSDSQPDYRFRHRFNIIYFAIRYAIHEKISCNKVVRHHLSILSKIYSNSLDYDIFVLIFAFKFFASDHFAKNILLDRFYDFHELHWIKLQDIAAPALNTIISCTDAMNIEVYSTREVIVYEHEFNTNNYFKKFGYLMSYSDNKIYAMNPSNCINNTFLPFGQILVEAIQYELLRTKDKIFVTTDSKVSKADSSEDKIKGSSSVPGNSYLIVHDRCNWYHFIMETMIPLFQILASNQLHVDNIIIPSSVYDNKNRLQLLKTLAQITLDFNSMVIKLDQSLCLENVFWSAITYPQDSHLNSAQLSEGGSWPSSIITEFSQSIKSSIDLNQKKSFNKIYLKRSSSLNRECENIEEVENLIIKKFGFEPVELEKFSFHEQVSILSNCEFVVGPTGAAWTNIIFCDKKKSVKAICWGLNLKYRCIWEPLANSANVELIKMYTTDSDSYSISCNNLSENIEVIISKID
tara:strand:+ start:124 stop:1872 length:1749 start_codon:yes stop_codon:yes gene_type:complete